MTTTVRISTDLLNRNFVFFRQHLMLTKLSVVLFFLFSDWLKANSAAGSTTCFTLWLSFKPQNISAVLMKCVHVILYECVYNDHYSTGLMSDIHMFLRLWLRTDTVTLNICYIKSLKSLSSVSSKQHWD